MALRSLKDMVGSVFCRGCSHHTGSTSDLAQKSIRNSVNTAKAQAGECCGDCKYLTFVTTRENTKSVTDNN